MAKALVETFVEVLEEIGLDQAKREQLHRAFERRDGAAHEAFLLALGMDARKVAAVRAKSR